MKYPIPGDWDGSTWYKWAVCWPDSELWRGFLRGLLTLPARGWTWDASTGDLMAVIETGKEIRAANLPLVGSFMSCNDENLASAFTDIAAAIRLLAARSSANGCCDTPETVIQNSIQNFVVQPVGGNPIPVYGSEPTLGLGTGEFPPEFETEEEFNLAKCQVAHMIIDRFIKTLRDLGSITNFDFYALGGAVVAIIGFNLAFPPALIPTLIGAMIILAAAAYYLPQVADYVQDNREEWICMLYEGESTELIIGAIADAADIAVAFVTAPTGLGAAIKLVIMVVLNADNVNELFRGLAASGYPDAECTCGCQELQIDLSTREFLAAYTWAEVATYDSLGTTAHTNTEDGHLQLENSETPDSAGIFRFTVDNPDDLEFGRIVISNQVGACCNVYFFVLVEDAEGVVTSPFASNAIAGEHYESAANFETPVIVKGLIVYAGNSINQGFDWTIENILLTCAI